MSWWIAVGWSPDEFFAYFLSMNLDIVKGYTDAMSYGPSRLSLTLAFIYWLTFFLIISLINRTFHASKFDRLLKKPTININDASATAALFMLSWVVFKAAFVRDDGVHTVVGGLYLVSFLVVTTGFQINQLFAAVNCGRRAQMTNPLLSPLILSGFLVFISGYKPPLNIFHDLYRGLADAAGLVTPQGRQQIGMRRQEALSGLGLEAEAYGIPTKSSADIIPWDITNLLANSLSYSPRPIPQSYSVYDSSLQKANKNFLLSSAPPDYLIINIQDIDGRLPISLDSPLLLSLGKRYSFSHRGSKGSLVFKKKSNFETSSNTKLYIKCTTLSNGKLDWSKSGRFRWNTQDIPLDSRGRGPITLTANFKDSAWRSILSTMYRPFPMFVEYLDHYGKILESYRLIPKAAQEMLIYPLVKNNDDFLMVVKGSTPAPSGQEFESSISSIRITTSSVGVPFFASDYSLSQGCIY
jgi:hypothetical protein